jgi:uncharacterized protein (DUF2336 family)
VELARRQGQEHLLAISRRESLSERVTDVLVDRGDARVVRSVAANEGARFSAASFARLVEAARADGYLQHALESRRDLPPEQRRKLLAIARAVAREALRAELGTGANPAIDAALDSAGAAIAGEDRLALPTPDNAAFARARQAGQLDEARIADWIREGRLDMALAGIADLAKVPVSMVSDAYHATSYDPLLFIVRSLRFGWGTFKLLLTHKAGRVPPQDVTRSAFDSFQQLSVATAQRVVRFTLTRHQAARAVPA